MSEHGPRLKRGLTWVAGASRFLALWLAADRFVPSTHSPRTGPDLAPMHLGAWSMWWQIDLGAPPVQRRTRERMGS